MTVLNITNLTKRFGKFKALDGIDLKLQPGEIFGFIGPNGAGKSTTLQIILGVLTPSSGNIEIFGKDALTVVVTIHEHLAFVPGDVNLWPNLTGGEVIDFFLSLHKHANYAKKERLIEQFDLDISKKCGTYSKGNRQKVALIAALSIDAELYIFDEPTSGLDPLMEDVFQSCIKEIKANNGTVLLSSHILSEVEKLCDRVAIIRKGKIIENGTLAELRHLTRMNFIVETSHNLHDLPNIAGVHNIQQSGSRYSFDVDSNKLTPLIQYLSQFTLTYLESKPPTLEDLFRRHYGDTIEEGE